MMWKTSCYKGNIAHMSFIDLKQAGQGEFLSKYENLMTFKLAPTSLKNK